MDNNKLIALYRTMVRIRLSEEALVEPIMNGEIRCPVHLYSGQEAIAAGVCAALRPRDYVFGTHRSHGHYLAKGGELKAMYAEIFCRRDGCARGRGGSMHLVAPEVGMLGAAPIVGGTVALAVGSGMAASIRKDELVAVAFFGDGAMGEGVVLEAMNLAAVHRWPVLFVCENNLYSTHMPIRECRVKEDIAEMAPPLGLEARAVDGNDVIAVNEAAEVLVKRARAGEGPAFLECKTYRMRGHVGPDDNIQGTHTDIRTPEEIVKWQARDPIVLHRKYLIEKKGVDVNILDSIVRDAEREVLEALLFARTCSFPDEKGMRDYVFA